MEANQVALSALTGRPVIGRVPDVVGGEGGALGARQDRARIGTGHADRSPRWRGSGHEEKESAKRVTDSRRRPRAADGSGPIDRFVDRQVTVGRANDGAGGPIRWQGPARGHGDGGQL